MKKISKSSTQYVRKMKSDSEKCCVYHKWYILIEESALCGIDESERECVMNANWERECNTLRLRTEREKERENAMLWYNERRNIFKKSWQAGRMRNDTQKFFSPLQRLQMIARECYHPKWEKMGLESKQNVNFSKK